MGMITHVVGIRLMDDDYRKHLAVWNACTAAGVAIPRMTLDLFGGEYPEPTGVLVELDDKCAVKWSDGEGCEGYEVHLDMLPSGVKRIRFYNSY